MCETEVVFNYIAWNCRAWGLQLWMLVMWPLCCCLSALQMPSWPLPKSERQVAEATNAKGYCWWGERLWFCSSSQVTVPLPEVKGDELWQPCPWLCTGASCPQALNDGSPAPQVMRSAEAYAACPEIGYRAAQPGLELKTKVGLCASQVAREPFPVFFANVALETLAWSSKRSVNGAIGIISTRAMSSALHPLRSERRAVSPLNPSLRGCAAAGRAGAAAAGF